ncbi:MAG: 50S ribosomal protein L18 [Candidatus Aenigmatarchaeota archaeon]
MRKTKILPLKRRLDGKTNYRKRLAAVRSKKPRVAARITNNYVSLQLISYDGGDKTKLSYISKKLESLGWRYSKKSLPACYLTGLVFGLECVRAGEKEAVFDMGLARVTAGNRYFAVLKGLSDSGLGVPCSEGNFPNDERAAGKHISEDVAKKFAEVKQKILSDYGKKE